MTANKQNKQTVTLAVDDATASEIVKRETDVINAIARTEKGEGIYVPFIVAHGVTLDTVPGYVAALTARAYPGVKADGRADKQSREYKAKQFQNRVRNGLNTALGKVSTPEADVIRVSLSGDGGLTVTLRKGDEGYDAALAIVTAAADESAAA